MANKPKPLPSLEYLKECFDYDPLTGDLIWKTRPREHFKSDGAYSSWNTKWSNKPTGKRNTSYGYSEVVISNSNYKIHRIIWKLYYSQEPTKYIDHINRDRSDNRIENLRECEQHENIRNTRLYISNKSGFAGVYFHKKKWIAYIRINNKLTHLGCFSTKEEAIKKRLEVAYAISGEFFPEHLKPELIRYKIID